MCAAGIFVSIPAGGDWSITEKVQRCGDACGRLAAIGIGLGGAPGIDESRAQLPVHALLDFSGVMRLDHGLDFSGDWNRGFGFASWVRDPGYTLFTREGGIFGTPSHFDQGCDGTLTVQYEGRKRWALWSPWDLSDDVPAQTRYETVLAPGEMLFYPPAWLHSTTTVEGDSISAAFDVQYLPAFGAVLANQSLWATPFGFERCAGGRRGWRAQSKALELALQETASTSEMHGDEL